MQTLIGAGVAIAMVAAAGPARAEDPADAGKAWALGQVQAMAALSPSIKAAHDHAWLIIPYGDQQAHRVPDKFYNDEIAPRLDKLADTWLPTLKPELETRLRAVTYPAVAAVHETRKETGKEVSYCQRFLPTIKDGRIELPPLASALFATCRSQAPGIVTGVLMHHADALDLSLAGLPRLDTAYPGWFTADLGKPNGDSPAALDPLRTRQAYVDRLGTRLQAAEPALERQLDSFHAGQGWAGERLAPPAVACTALLGPMQAGSVGPAEYEPVRQALTVRCIEGARARLMAVLTKMQAALPGALATRLPPNGPLRSPGRLCSDIIGGWLGQGDYPSGFEQPLEASCAGDAATATAAAIKVRAEQFAAPLLALPRTLEALKEHAWFGLDAVQLGPLTLPDDPGRDDVLAQFMAVFKALVAPAAAAGVDDGKSRIAAAYARAAGSAEAFQEVLRLCGGDGTGARLPSAGRGGETYRDQIASACGVGHQALPGARVTLAQARSGVAVGPPVRLLLPSDNGEVVVVLQDLVARAALAGVQLRISAGTLGFNRLLIASPMGLDTPALTGPVTQVREGWRLSAFDTLPGWPADPADTVACLALSDGDVAGAQVEAFFLLFASAAAADDDRPRTARRGFARGLERLRQAGAMHACQEARRKFLGQPGR